MNRTTFDRDVGNALASRPIILGLIGGGAALLFWGGLVASCTPDKSAPELQSRTDHSQLEQPELTSLTLPTPEVWIEPFTDQTCLECHTNQERLVELALPDEPQESLSEGPG